MSFRLHDARQVARDCTDARTAGWRDCGSTSTEFIKREIGAWGSWVKAPLTGVGGREGHRERRSDAAGQTRVRELRTLPHGRVSASGLDRR
jgi:hypothetical protein